MSEKCFGFVAGYDTKPTCQIAALLEAQGFQMNQAITFLSDGGVNVRDLQLYLILQRDFIRVGSGALAVVSDAIDRRDNSHLANMPGAPAPSGHQTPAAG